MMPKVEATNTSKIEFLLQDFFAELIKSPNDELYCNLCSSTVSCKKRFLAGNHPNTPNQNNE